MSNNNAPKYVRIQDDEPCSYCKNEDNDSCDICAGYDCFEGMKLYKRESNGGGNDHD